MAGQNGPYWPLLLWCYSVLLDVIPNSLFDNFFDEFFRQIFFDDFFFQWFFFSTNLFTYNLLTIASFKVGVSLILFKWKLFHEPKFTSLDKYLHFKLIECFRKERLFLSQHNWEKMHIKIKRPQERFFFHLKVIEKVVIFVLT